MPMTKTVMILATDGFEQSELEKPKAALEEAGVRTEVVSLKNGAIKGWDKNNWGREVPVDRLVDDVHVTEYDALLLPGGQINPDTLRLNERAVALVKGFAVAGKPIAAICHGPWLLVEAGIVNGRTVTGWSSIRTDLRNAGANVVDEEVAVDENLITSRNPDDIPAFNRALLEQLDLSIETEAA